MSDSSPKWLSGDSATESFFADAMLSRRALSIMKGSSPADTVRTPAALTPTIAVCTASCTGARKTWSGRRASPRVPRREKASARRLVDARRVAARLKSRWCSRLASAVCRKRGCNEGCESKGGARPQGGPDLAPCSVGRSTMSTSSRIRWFFASCSRWRVTAVSLTTACGAAALRRGRGAPRPALPPGGRLGSPWRPFDHPRSRASRPRCNGRPDGFARRPARL